MKNGDRPKLTDLQRRLIVGVGIGAVVIAAIGFVGSYAAVRRLAEAKGFGDFAYAFPIGIDAGILVLLALDLLLTWLRMQLAMLRHTAWLLTFATIAFNGAAAWPDPVGTGMHGIIPVLFVVTIEAARHAIGRAADITADKHMEGVRLSRWLLAPSSTFRLWRRMKLWELRSYDQVIQLERQRLIEKARLRGKYGRRWRSKAPVEAVMALRLTRYGRELSLVEGILDIEHAPARVPARVLAARASAGADGEPAGMLGSAPALPELPPASREPGDEPVSPEPMSREPMSRDREPDPEPGPRAEPEQSLDDHATAAIQITLPTPPAEPTAPREPGEPSPEPDRTDSPVAGETALAVLLAFAQEAPEPASIPADPPLQPAPTPARAHAPVLSAEQRDADAAWHAIEAAARRTALSSAHTLAPALLREPQVPEPVSRAVSPEPTREPSPEPAREPGPSREPATEPTGEPGQAEADAIEQQITTLLAGLRDGDRLTKTLAAQLLGVSEATAGRRLKAARARLSNEGTGLYL
ncbi:DUF2637 domain-containing protein [Streptomyces phaeochromogenes]|uniref:DUF2637 domain-containing protein n=1 Tax=Streptomyces phaeochromogenes TaxID=1923 RepID=UPI0036A45202